MFTAQALLVRPVAAPKNLARNDERIPRPPFLFQNITHHDLGSTLGVGLSVIEKIGTAVVRDGHQLLGRFIANLLRKRDPRAKRKLAQLQSRFPEVSIFHTINGRRSFPSRSNLAAPEARSPAAWKPPFFLSADKVASNAEVANTIPRNRAVVQLGRTLEWGSRGRGFKSRRPEILLCPGTQTFSLCATGVLLQLTPHNLQRTACPLRAQARRPVFRHAPKLRFFSARGSVRTSCSAQELSDCRT